MTFRPQDAPHYALGFELVLITSLAAGVLLVVYRYLCVWENRNRDKAGIAEGFEHAYEDDLTDKKVFIAFFEFRKPSFPFASTAGRELDVYGATVQLRLMELQRLLQCIAVCELEESTSLRLCACPGLGRQQTHGGRRVWYPREHWARGSR